MEHTSKGLLHLENGKSSASSLESVVKKERKFERKVQFYAKVKDSVLAAQKVIGKNKKLRNREKKLKAFDLSTLIDFLPNVSTSKKTAPVDLKWKCKRRRHFVMKEDSQLKVVLNHPMFQSDPLGSIYQHLSSTQPASPEKPAKLNKDKKKRVEEVQNRATNLQYMET